VDYELDWPAELLGSELLALRDHPHRAWTADEIKLLLREAFHTNVPVNDFTRLSSAGEWAGDLGPGRGWVDDLLTHLHELRQYSPPRPYWAARRAAPAEQPVRVVATAPRRFADLVEHLHANGYLDRDFGGPCVYGPPSDFVIEELGSVLQQRLERADLWPLRPESWDEATFYGLIEVFHDLVARPRSYWECQDCGDGHFWDFDTDAGRRVHRALVNRLLAENAVELRLAESGEDLGRLVHLADEGRTDLVQRALASPEPAVVGRVGHAIALFRGRDATEHHKRSAIVALHLVLEERRKLLKKSLSRKDEGALFQIANEFALRHGSEQQSDYDPVFLDWVFWWYLATVELTDRLLASQDAEHAP
jgi:hypothetical protein